MDILQRASCAVCGPLSKSVLTKVLVLFVAWRVSRLTLLGTLWRLALLSGAGRSGAVHMVLTGSDGVGPAAWRQSVNVT